MCLGFTKRCEMILGLGDFNRHVGRRIDGFEGVMVELELLKEMLRKETAKF